MSLIVLLAEIPIGCLLVLTSVIRGWGSEDGQPVAPAMDWAPILRLGGFTAVVFIIAAIFLYAAHPFAGAVQLLVAAVALTFTVAAWHDQYEHAHPSSRAASSSAARDSTTALPAARPGNPAHLSGHGPKRNQDHPLAVKS
ncbi:DUF6234 family protein [Streptomyces sp. NPDC002690]